MLMNRTSLLLVGQGRGNGRHLAGAVLLLLGVTGTHAAHAQGAAIGSLRIVRQVEVTRGGTGQAATYVPARDKESVFAGEGVRTLKRSQAEVNFTDGSVLRVNERTDLVVQNTAALRNFQLRGGVVWVRVAKGVRTQVETPSATAVARGTVFTVAVLKGGATQLTVLEGTVDIQVGGKVVSVPAGETITVTQDRAGSSGATAGSNVDIHYSLPDLPTRLSAADLPIEFGGSYVGWWTTLDQNVGVITAPGSDFLFDLRSSPLTEAVQQFSAAGINNQSTSRDYFLPTVQERQQFFTNSNSDLRAAWQQYVPNKSSFLSSNGGNSLTSLNLSASQIAALQSLNINTVGDAVQTFQANAASAGVTVNFDRSRAAYRAGSLTGTPNFDYRLLDRNETSLAFVGVGALAALLTDSSKLAGAKLPTLSGQAYAFANDPALVGGRGRIDGTIGRTSYHAEGNVLRILSGDNEDTYSKADSVLYVEHPLGNAVNVFAGRKRFYEGPVFQDQAQSQLIAERYTGAGATYKSKEFTLTGAYLYDTNPDVRGAQNGALGSAYVHGYGGVLGLHYLRVPKLSSGDGFSASITYPILPNKVDFYGEVGRAPDKATIQTYGAYFPGLFQKTDIDLFVEYGSHDGIGHSLSFIGSRDISQLLNVRAYASFTDGTNDVKGGVAGIFRFSTK